MCRKDLRCRKPRDPRKVLNSILRVLRTGAPWKDSPARYPPYQYQICCGRFQQWVKAGVFRHIIEASAADLQKLAEMTLESLFITGKPEKLIGDKRHDSDKLDDELQKKHGVELIALHRCNRTKAKTQDGRKLRRYKRRWKIERLFAQLQNFRQLVVRYEQRAENFSAFFVTCLLSYSAPAFLR